MDRYKHTGFHSKNLPSLPAAVIGGSAPEGMEQKDKVQSVHCEKGYRIVDSFGGKISMRRSVAQGSVSDGILQMHEVSPNNFEPEYKIVHIPHVSVTHDNITEKFERINYLQLSGEDAVVYTAMRVFLHPEELIDMTDWTDEELDAYANGKY